MNKKHAVRLFNGAATVVAVGAVLMAVSGMARGLEPRALETTLAVPAQQTETRIKFAQADVAPLASPVSYSSDQADRGKEDFNDHCAECHGDDLRGGLVGGPPLRGLSFEQKFLNGAPASGLFLFMSSLMPPNAPGRFSPGTYADMMAYILKQNGFQAGAPLPSDVDALDNLILEK